MSFPRAGSLAVSALLATVLAGVPPATAASAASRTSPDPAGADWPQFGFDASRTGDNASDTVLGPGNVAALRQKWSFRTSDRVETSPAVVSGVVYATSIDGHLYALRAATGTRLWSFAGPSLGLSSPAVAGGVVYAGSPAGGLYALDAATGAVRWQFATGGRVFAAPAVTGGVVYAAATVGNGGAIFALSAATGAVLWRFATPRLSLPQGLAVADGTVYAATSNDLGQSGGLYALAAATGMVRWHDKGQLPLFTPVAADGLLYVVIAAGTAKAEVLAVRPRTGALVWSSVPTGVDESWPAVADGRVYIGDSMGFVWAFNATTGVTAWRFPAPSGVEASPVVANGVVYVSDEDGNLHALADATGRELAHFPTGTAIISAASVVGGAVYVGNFDQRVYAYALPAAARAHGGTR